MNPLNRLEPHTIYVSSLEHRTALSPDPSPELRERGAKPHPENSGVLEVAVALSLLLEITLGTGLHHCFQNHLF